jgi:uncharacterized protein (TIGR03083 family)
VASELVALLRRLESADWDRPTVAGAWRVRDVVAHLVDLTFRRLSFHRDRMFPPPPPRPINSERDFVAFINDLNAEWVNASRRFSPRVLTDLFEKASADLADWFEQLPFDSPALFGVSWAGEQTSEGWFDVGREFTELWHHQQQIRMAVGAPTLEDPRFLRAVLEIALRSLPHAYRNTPAVEGDAVAIQIDGVSGGSWTLERDAERWLLRAGEPVLASTRVRISDDTAWKLFFNALSEREARASLVVEGRADLAEPLVRARAIVV